MLRDFHLPPLKGGAPACAVIFLHGLGDRGDGGLLSIGQMWQRALPDCEFFCPDAPFPFDVAPPDFGGKQWFSLSDLSPASTAEGVLTAAPILNDYIDHILAIRNLTADRLAIVGFSQGTMMALQVAPRRDQTVACVIGYSGLLAMPEKLAVEKKSAPPVLLVHGTADEVVPFTHMAEAERYLKAAEIPIRTVACPMVTHTIDETGLREGLAFLLENFKNSTR